MSDSQLKFVEDNPFFNSHEAKVGDNGHVEINTTVICESSGEKEQIKIVFQHDKNYDPTYESEQMKMIKESGMISDNEIKHENGYMIFKDGGFSIDTPQRRDWEYRYKYISNRDKKTVEELQDKQVIYFHHETFDSDLECDEYGSGDEENDDKYGYSYQDFLDKKEVPFKNPDEIVLAQSYIRVHFNSPTYRDHVTFTLHANDEMKGFTRRELAYKCMQYYHLQFYLCQNYDMDKGCFVQSKAIQQLYNKNSEFHQVLEAEHVASGYNMDWMNKEPPKDLKFPEPIFRPVLFFDEYTNNGLSYLQYNKQREYWVFDCLTYL